MSTELIAALAVVVERQQQQVERLTQSVELLTQSVAALLGEEMGQPVAPDADDGLERDWDGNVIG